MAKNIQDYTKGNINVNNFRASLMEYNVPIDNQLDKLIRKHEAGDVQTYKEFGKHIFRQLNGTETYNRVDKINMNDTKIVAPEKTGKNHFALADEIKQPKTRALDDHHIGQEARHLGATYQERKGTGITGVNQLKSQAGGIINGSTQGPNTDFNPPSKSINLREQRSSDIFGTQARGGSDNWETQSNYSSQSSV
jgi:hypothetical protein